MNIFYILYLQGRCPTPVTISLPPTTGQNAQGIQAYDCPPPYSGTVPSAPPGIYVTVIGLSS